MKTLFIVFSLLCFLSAEKTASAAIFKLEITKQETILVSDPQGQALVEIPLGSLNREVSLPTGKLQISYGRNAKNQLSALIYPHASTPRPLEIQINQQSIKTDGNAYLTLNVESDYSSLSLNPGILGQVWINQQPTPLREAITIPLISPKSDSLLSESDRIPSAGKDQITATPPLFSSEKHSSPFPTETTEFQWTLPLSPDSIEQTKNDEIGQIRLVEVVGTVTIHLPQSPSSETRAVSGMILPSQSIVSTGENSTVAAVMGGLHSVRLVPQTDASFSQSKEKLECKSEVSLTKGSLFAEVNKRKGMTQNFQIKTPAGTASATGSKAQVSFKSGKMSLAAAESRWQGTDNSGKFAFSTIPTISPNTGLMHFLGLASIPQMDGKELLKEATQGMQSAKEVNTLTQKITGTTSPPSVSIHNTFSLTVSNSSTMADGSINPTPLLGALIIPAQELLVSQLVTPEQKDQGKSGDVIISDKKITDPTQVPSSNTTAFQPRQTTPGGI